MSEELNKLKDQLREANTEYAEAKRLADDARTQADWMDQRRLDVGRKIGQLRAAIMKAKP